MTAAHSSNASSESKASGTASVAPAPDVSSRLAAWQAEAENGRAALPRDNPLELAERTALPPSA